MPAFIVDGIKDIVGATGEVWNATYLFIGNKGARCINNVNEIEHYEFGAALASDAMLNAMDALDVGVSEMELGSILNAQGQKNSVVTIAAAGKRFVKANLYPTDNKVKTGDPISLTVAYKGGLSSRAGYAVESLSQLPENIQEPQYPMIDAILTTSSVVAQILLTRKKIDNWVIWVIVDVVYIGLFLMVGMYWTAGLYVVYTGIAVNAVFSWRKEQGTGSKE